MPSLGPLEIITVLVVALIVFGPSRLPEIARNVGRAINELRRTASELRSEFEIGLDDDAGPAASGNHADDDVEVIPDVLPRGDAAAGDGATPTGDGTGGNATGERHAG